MTGYSYDVTARHNMVTAKGTGSQGHRARQQHGIDSSHWYDSGVAL